MRSARACRSVALSAMGAGRSSGAISNEPLAGRTADDALQSPLLRPNLELGAAHGLLRLQCGNPAAEQLDLRDLAAAYARLVQGHDLLQTGSIVASQREILLRELQIDECLLDLQPQRADGIEDFGFGDGPLLLSHSQASVALRAAFEEEIDAHAVLGRSGAVRIVEPGAQDIEVIAAQAQHRIRPEPCRDDVCVGNRHSSTRGDEREVPLERFGDGGIEREAWRSSDRGSGCAATIGGVTNDATRTRPRRTNRTIGVHCSRRAARAESRNAPDSRTALATSVRFASVARRSSRILHGRA